MTGNTVAKLIEVINSKSIGRLLSKATHSHGLHRSLAALGIYISRDNLNLVNH